MRYRFILAVMFGVGPVARRCSASGALAVLSSAAFFSVAGFFSLAKGQATNQIDVSPLKAGAATHGILQEDKANHILPTQARGVHFLRSTKRAFHMVRAPRCAKTVVIKSGKKRVSSMGKHKVKR